MVGQRAVACFRSAVCKPEEQDGAGKYQRRFIGSDQRNLTLPGAVRESQGQSCHKHEGNEGEATGRFPWGPSRERRTSTRSDRSHCSGALNEVVDEPELCYDRRSEDEGVEIGLSHTAVDAVEREG